VITSNVTNLCLNHVIEAIMRRIILCKFLLHLKCAMFKVQLDGFWRETQQLLQFFFMFVVPSITNLFYHKEPTRCSFKQSFIYRLITLHVLCALRTHHQEYIKLLLQTLVQVLIWPWLSEVDARPRTSFNGF